MDSVLSYTFTLTTTLESIIPVVQEGQLTGSQCTILYNYSLFHAWTFSPFHSIQLNEALNAHPQKNLSYMDRKRLKLTELNRLTMV